MSPLELKRGQIALYKGRKVAIEAIVNLSDVKIVELETGEILTVPIAELEILMNNSKVNTPINPDSSQSKYWEIVEKRYEIIKPLLTSNRKRKNVEVRAKEFGLNSTTLYRWIKRFEESGGLISSLTPNYSRRGGKGIKRKPSNLERLIKEVIYEIYLNPSKRVSIKRAYQVLVLRCKKEGLSPPHINTFRNRIKEISPFVVAKKREGRVVAQGKFGSSSKSFEPEYPLEVIQTDHTPVDIIVVDEKTREPIGRPYLTLAMDVYSRMVYGYYLSLEAPGYFSVAQALLMGILPKDVLLEELSVEGKWEIWGIPQKIHVDNASEFRSSHLERFCKEYGITIDYRPRKTPHYGGHIERLIGTLNQEIHNLPGTTFSNPVERKDYKSEKKAAFTLFELEKWLVHYIVNIYHKRIHSELEMTPEEKYELGIFGDSTTKGRGLPKMITGKEAELLKLSLLPSFKRSVQKDGVHFIGLRYYDNVLKPFIRLRRKGDKIDKYIFKYDPRDIRFIYFQHPKTEEFYRIPCRDRRLPRLSLWEFREAKKKLNLKKKYNEMQLVEGIQKLMQIEENVEISKKTKRRKNNNSMYKRKEKIEGKISETTEVKEHKTVKDSTDEFWEDLDDIEPFEVE